MGVVWRLARRTAIVALALLAATIVAVVYHTDRHLELHGEGRALSGPVDAIIVLGGGIMPDGTLGQTSRRRVEVAVALLAEGKAGSLILSGKGTHDGAPHVLAEAMRRYAIGLGAPAGALLVEDRSLSTFGNLRFSFALAEARGFRRLAILTDAFHLERARVLAWHFGHGDAELIAVAGLGRYYSSVHSWHIAREALAWWFNLGKVAAWLALTAAGIDVETREAWIR